MIDPDLLEILRCPSTGLPLRVEGDELVTADGNKRYSVIAGIPCLIPDWSKPTHSGYERLLGENERQRSAIITANVASSFIQGMIVSTCGNLYRGAILSGKYPIPAFPKFSERSTLLDIGCNWGRWTIAGAKAGHRMIGVDIHLRSLLCAQWLSEQLLPANRPRFVLADARYLPFTQNALEGVYSYSCIQHFSKENAAIVLSEVGRVMKSQGKALIQMPNKSGIRNKIVQARRMFSEGREFEVRYYAIAELLELFKAKIGSSQWFVDCFLGLNVHAAERDLVPGHKKWIIDIAEALRWISDRSPFLRNLSDSVFVTSTKS